MDLTLNKYSSILPDSVVVGLWALPVIFFVAWLYRQEKKSKWFRTRYAKHRVSYTMLLLIFIVFVSLASLSAFRATVNIVQHLRAANQPQAGIVPPISPQPVNATKIPQMSSAVPAPSQRATPVIPRQTANSHPPSEPPTNSLVRNDGYVGTAKITGSQAYAGKGQSAVAVDTRKGAKTEKIEIVDTTVGPVGTTPSPKYSGGTGVLTDQGDPGLTIEDVSTCNIPTLVSTTGDGKQNVTLKNDNLNNAKSCNWTYFMMYLARNREHVPEIVAEWDKHQEKMLEGLSEEEKKSKEGEFSSIKDKLIESYKSPDEFTRVLNSIAVPPSFDLPPLPKGDL